MESHGRRIVEKVNQRSFRMRQRGRTFFVRALSFIVVLGLAGCNANVRRSGIPAAAQTSLQAAIDDIDSGRYDKLYQEASDEWRKQSSPEESKATLQRMRDKLGEARSRTQQTAREEQTSTAPVAGHSVTVVYQTTFDRGEAIETFTLIERGGHWALAKYYVSSSGLR
jgi:hypothetical protein